MATDVPRVYPEPFVTDAAFVAPGAATGVKWNNKPGRMAAKLIIWDWIGSGTITAYLQTSPDGINWSTVPGNYSISFNGDAQIVMPIANPVLPWFRFNFVRPSGNSNARVKIIIAADAPQALVGRYVLDPDAPKDFDFCSFRKTVDGPLGAIAAPVNGSLCRVSGAAEKAWLVVALGAATMGTLTARVQTSFDGGLTWNDCAFYQTTATLLAHSMLIAFDSWTDFVTDMLRVVYTPAGGWDGTHLGATLWTGADCGPN